VAVCMIFSSLHDQLCLLNVVLFAITINRKHTYSITFAF